MLYPVIQNIVSTINMKTQLDLKVIALKSLNSEYNPRRFSALIMRIRKPARTTALIFATGKMVVTGAKCVKEAESSCRKFIKIIKKLGFNPIFSEFKVQNIVCSMDLNFLVHLEKMNIIHEKFTTYEPELFPGLIFRISDIVYLIFNSGKIVATGGKDLNLIHDSFEKLYPLLQNFKRIK
jgi:transcription initiation factor TFIID TATA-box-binding protein